MSTVSTAQAAADPPVPAATSKSVQACETKTNLRLGLYHTHLMSRSFPPQPLQRRIVNRILAGFE